MAAPTVLEACVAWLSLARGERRAGAFSWVAPQGRAHLPREGLLSPPLVVSSFCVARGVFKVLLSSLKNFWKFKLMSLFSRECHPPFLTLVADSLRVILCRAVPPEPGTLFLRQRA